MPQLQIDRSKIGSLTGTFPKMKRVLAIISHITVGNQSSTLDGVISTLNANGLGYHYVIDRNARIFQLVEETIAAYHAGYANTLTLGVALIGSDTNLTQQQITVGKQLVEELLTKYGLEKTNVLGHGELTKEFNDRGLRSSAGDTRTPQGWAKAKQITEGMSVVRLVRGIRQVPQALKKELVQYGVKDSLFNAGDSPSTGRILSDPIIPEISYSPIPTVGVTESFVPDNLRRDSLNNDFNATIASLKSFHPKIQRELARRKLATQTSTVNMPFVKLTSLLKVRKADIFESPNDQTPNGYCPSIGIHGNPNVTFDEIYFPRPSFRSTVGQVSYSGPNGTTLIRPLLAQKSIDLEPTNIPLPGITELTTERGLSGPLGIRGGLIKAKLKINAYSVGQVDTLLTYFLRPATYLVLEFGQLSPQQAVVDTFDWKRSLEEITAELEEIAKTKTGAPTKQKEFADKYVYGNGGKYEILVSYVSDFDIKVEKNVYKIELTVASIQQFEAPTIQSGLRTTCNNVADPCKVVSVSDYFSLSSAWKPNSFSRLMYNVLSTDGSLHSDWASHVIEIASPIINTEARYVERSSLTTWDTTVIASENSSKLALRGENAKSAGQTTLGLTNGNYYVSWKFFVDVMLNHPTLGILSVFPESSHETIRKGLLSPLTTQYNKLLSTSTDSLVPNEVGYHPFLRSTNPMVMVIYNGYAQQNEEIKRRWSSTLNYIESDKTPSGEPKYNIYQNSHIESSMQASRSVVKTFGDGLVEGAPLDTPSSTLLNTGVWIHTAAIRAAFESANFISKGIEKLLVDMSNATETYWSLQLMSSDDSNFPGLHVIDANLPKYKAQARPPAEVERKRQLGELTNTVTEYQEILDADYGTDNDPKYVYVFNSRSRSLSDDDIGSELLDFDIKYDLPVAVAIQALIGTGGTSHRSTLQAFNSEELKALDIFPPATDSTSTCSDPIVGNPQCAEQLQFFYKRKGIQEVLNIDELDTRPIPTTTPPATESATTPSTNPIENRMVINAIRNYGDFGTSLALVELDSTFMLVKLHGGAVPAVQVNPDGTATRIAPAAVNNFNSSNLTNIIINLRMPGIAGIRLWETFLVDKIPTIITNGFFTVTKIKHTVTTKGWTTELQGRLRYVPQNVIQSVTPPSRIIGTIPPGNEVPEVREEEVEQPGTTAPASSVPTSSAPASAPRGSADAAAQAAPDTSPQQPSTILGRAAARRRERAEQRRREQERRAEERRNRRR